MALPCYFTHDHLEFGTTSIKRQTLIEASL